MAADAVRDRRTAQIAVTLAGVRARIEAACVAAGRDPAELTLVAVTKTFPVEDARRLLALGVADLGEARDQEARVKARELPEARWHFVGRLQRNKARSVAAYAALVHTVDRPDLVDALAAGVRRAGRERLDVLVQVSLDGDPNRGGAPVADVEALADAAEATGVLRPAGVMAIAPLGTDPDTAFAGLADVSYRLRSARPDATLVSAGMSGDLEAAVRHGATHLRIGTALLGGRPPVRG
ncbi:MAG TPA: YggS family pyridoxal phosphate-dependent enzyme [Mycobacteriales bacterium]|nr:YggS family pyridoxal phosphate-dependent enzyme [Mycobacteriales bacterium]